MNEVEAVSPEDDWRRLLLEEVEAFSRCVRMDEQNPFPTPEKSAAVRGWWGIVNRILWMCTRTRMQSGRELQPFPAETFARLANISEELGKGNLPSFVSDVARRGRPLWRKERHAIAYGVLYIEAAKRGDIPDRAPNKTVRQAYNVTARAVQGWIERRDEIVAGVPRRHLTADQLREKMLKSGAEYSRSGRGAPSEN